MIDRSNRQTDRLAGWSVRPVLNTQDSYSPSKLSPLSALNLMDWSLSAITHHELLAHAHKHNTQSFCGVCVTEQCCFKRTALDEKKKGKDEKSSGGKWRLMLKITHIFTWAGDMVVFKKGRYNSMEKILKIKTVLLSVRWKYLPLIRASWASGE